MMANETTCELLNPRQWKPNMTEAEEADLAKSNRTVEEILNSREDYTNDFANTNAAWGRF